MSDDAVHVGLAPYRGPARRTCTVEDCEEMRYAAGFCHRHYTRWRRHQNPLVCIASADRKNVRLTPDDVTQIRKMRGDGMTQKAVAQIFDIDRSTVSKVDTGRNWAAYGR